MIQSEKTQNTRWSFWIDRGGTFTDIVAVDPSGETQAFKLLSENAAHYDDAAVEGIRRCLQSPRDTPLPADKIASIKMGTTVATNALLERKGAPVVLVTTAGLTDQLEIGTQARNNIFALNIKKHDLLFERTIAARERVRADGTVETALDQDRLRDDLKAARQDGFSAVAIVFMHAYAFPDHEQVAAQIARDIGFPQISTSHDVAPVMGLVARGDTTVADAYLSPGLATYVANVSRGFDHELVQDQSTQLLFMASSGGLTPASQFRGRDAVLSGPAGGVVAMAKTASHLGFEHVIGFDMGGTSTDVAHFDGTFERRTENEISGVRLSVPMLDVETVAAGGGSIIHSDGARLQVGPESAGADPGPACYRRGGPLTVTDANLMVGKLNPAWFPHVFGPDGDAPLDRNIVNTAFTDLARTMSGERSPLELADGAIRIAVENMSHAIKKISVGRGRNTQRYALQCFGAAAGQHACLVADTLGIKTILVHPLSGVLSAYGMGLADLRATQVHTVEQPLNANTLSNIRTRVDTLTDSVSRNLENAGVARCGLATTVYIHLKYEHAQTTLPVALSDLTTLRQDFEREHKARFGYIAPNQPVHIATVEVTATGGGVKDSPQDTMSSPDDVGRPTPFDQTHMYSQGADHEALVYRRRDLLPGQVINGPALIIEDHQTVVLEPDWQGALSQRGTLVLTRKAGARATPAAVNSKDADPILLEVFNNQFMAIAEQMGAALASTAQSVNIKERLDFSCAVFDQTGALVANAPHVPVHLGSMDRAVTSVIANRAGNMSPGDSYLTNAPYDGGTHLPDLTVVTPVFDDHGTKIDFFVASRGHHADIGGTTPGSMSPNATTIEQEGVMFTCLPIVKNGIFLEDIITAHLKDAAYPARNPAQNIADLKAQVAANQRGCKDLAAMVRLHGSVVVQDYMRHIQDYGEHAVRRLLTKLSGGEFSITLDNGAKICVRIEIDQHARTATIDFTGTSPQQPNNFNAPEPVTRAAVLYVFRVMLEENIPINAGCLRPLKLVIPNGSLLNPNPPAAVVAGNVETSQVVTNALFAAFGALSSSQGTMNNLTFGNDTHQYYETICSGSPAGPGFDGQAAVQVHMTNTRLTDPEILEHRFPVVVDEFSIRRGSGGRGQWCAGDGTRRVLRFLETMSGAILSGFRKVQPHGLKGGGPGHVGRNTLMREDGTVEVLSGCSEVTLSPGDRIGIETPTGGGFGRAENRDKL